MCVCVHGPPPSQYFSEIHAFHGLNWQSGFPGFPHQCPMKGELSPMLDFLPRRWFQRGLGMALLLTLVPSFFPAGLSIALCHWLSPAAC
jgi:hypothetical protein